MQPHSTGPTPTSDRQAHANFDGAIAAPKSHKVVHESEKTRALQVSITPGHREPMHEHAWPSTFILLEPGAIEYFDQSGRLTECIECRPERTYEVTQLPPEGLHAVRNLSHFDYVALRIEFKGSREEHEVWLSQQSKLFANAAKAIFSPSGTREPGPLVQTEDRTGPLLFLALLEAARRGNLRECLPALRPDDVEKSFKELLASADFSGAVQMLSLVRGSLRLFVRLAVPQAVNAVLTGLEQADAIVDFEHLCGLALREPMLKRALEARYRNLWS